MEATLVHWDYIGRSLGALVFRVEGLGFRVCGLWGLGHWLHEFGSGAWSAGHE